MRRQPEFPLPQLIPLQIFDSDNKASIIRYLVSQTVLFGLIYRFLLVEFLNHTLLILLLQLARERCSQEIPH